MKTQLSGPIILSLSRELGPLLDKKVKLRFSIDLKPALSFVKLENRIKRELDKNPHLLFKDLLRKLLPAKFINTFVVAVNLSGKKQLKGFNQNELERLISKLKDFSFWVNGLGDFKEAIITAGGVSLDEINPETMESRKIKNLYFAGELINIDADTGGYNLQIAFSTANLAAISATKNRG